jgi:hypothetical protein
LKSLVRHLGKAAGDDVLQLGRKLWTGFQLGRVIAKDCCHDLTDVGAWKC